MVLFMGEEYAPVLISVYDRYHHFHRCIESLKNAELASKTVLYISSDGPVDDESRVKIERIRAYIATLEEFKDVRCFSPDVNTSGRVKKEAHAYMLENYTCFVKAEDDNYFSSDSLVFFNEKLRFYAGEYSVYGVCGNRYPFLMPGEGAFLPYFNFWGVGVWSDKILPMNFNKVEQAVAVLNDPDKFKKVFSHGSTLIWQLRRIAYKKLREGDISYSVYMILNGKVCVYPETSLVENFGADGTGQNCGNAGSVFGWLKSKLKNIEALLFCNRKASYAYFSSFYTCVYAKLTYFEHNSKVRFFRRLCYFFCEVFDFLKR